MALTTVSEATAANVVVEYLAGIQHNGMGVPDIEQLRVALRVLVRGANNKLAAGVSPERFDAEVWAKIEARVAALATEGEERS